jgi:hypothetical protein
LGAGREAAHRQLEVAVLVDDLARHREDPLGIVARGRLNARDGLFDAGPFDLRL